VAILRPELEVTLLESNKRKCVFLRESTRGLKNVQVLESRIQDSKDLFDWGIARAVAPEEVLASRLQEIWHWPFPDPTQLPTRKLLHYLGVPIES